MNASQLTMTPPTYRETTAESPLPPEVEAAGVRGGANMYGGFSIEKFCNAGDLSYTHEDVQGWLDYVKKFTPINFWYKDGGVRVWAYYEEYDDWQDTYGMDAVVAVYHSGHGGMDGNGVFYAPVGADWGGKGCTAVSSDMRLGNEHVKYIFWSTCLSCRVLDGQSPLRTWGQVNQGFRMLFGFETTSVDSPNYGKFFWEEWNKGTNKSLSTAWLDASWRIAHNQAPSAAAVGASADDSKNRVFNERYFSRDPVSRDWWWWRWYYAASTAREPQRTLPKSLLAAQLQPVRAQVESARGLADRFQLEMRLPDEVPVAIDGSFSVADGEMHIARAADGSIEARLAHPNLFNYTPIPARQARTIAQEAVRRYGLDQQTTLVFDRVILAQEAGGTAAGAGEIRGPYTTGTTVQYRQVINDLPVITPSAGTVRVSIDNDGRVTDVSSSVRVVERLSDRPWMTPPTPPPPAPAGGPPAGEPREAARTDGDPANYEQALEAAFSRQLAAWAITGKMPVEFTTVPGSTEVGYDISGDGARLIAHKLVEVDFGAGFSKLYWVSVPLFA